MAETILLLINIVILVYVICLFFITLFDSGNKGIHGIGNRRLVNRSKRKLKDKS